jgi:hypothetical protein
VERRNSSATAVSDQLIGVAAGNREICSFQNTRGQRSENRERTVA